VGAEPELIAEARALTGREPLLVVGGTFDPPHVGHVLLPEAARTALWGGRGRLVYVPATRSPLKEQSGEASPAHRIAMLRLAASACKRACIWTFETDRPPPSYTVDTLRALRAAVGHATDARLLIGADQACRFHQWREPREAIALAEPVVVPRSPCTDAAALRDALGATGFWSDAELAAWHRRFVATPLVGASASEVREALHQNPRPEAALRRMLPPGVLDYIDQHGLYRGGPDPLRFRS
jgi:nicotinate-nucleotide adenylyltransferase